MPVHWDQLQAQRSVTSMGKLYLLPCRVSIERMCAGREFQVEGADTEKARDEKLLVIPAGLVRRSVLEERKDLGGR